jgi:hypothetical protein
MPKGLLATLGAFGYVAGMNFILQPFQSFIGALNASAARRMAAFNIIPIVYRHFPIILCITLFTRKAPEPSQS